MSYVTDQPRLGISASATGEPAPVEDFVQTEDAPYGQVMFLAFAAAVVFVSCAVALLSVARSWWMLGLVCGVHLAATVIVCWLIARALTGRTGGRAAAEA